MACGFKTRPVIIGPVTFLHLAKCATDGPAFDKFSLLSKLVPVYEQLVAELNKAGAEWVQIDEPVLSLDLDVGVYADKFKQAYAKLHAAAGTTKIIVANYFGALRENLSIVASLPVDAVHIDLIRAPQELDVVLKALPVSMTVSLGVVNGRNIWKADLAATLKVVERAIEIRKSVAGTKEVHLLIAPSCSLLHTPFSLAAET